MKTEKRHNLLAKLKSQRQEFHELNKIFIELDVSIVDTIREIENKDEEIARLRIDKEDLIIFTGLSTAMILTESNKKATQITKKIHLFK